MEVRLQGYDPDDGSVGRDVNLYVEKGDPSVVGTNPDNYTHQSLSGDGEESVYISNGTLGETFSIMVEGNVTDGVVQFEVDRVRDCNDGGDDPEDPEKLQAPEASL